jgi:S-adenosylmethionine decarboxylase
MLSGSRAGPAFGPQDHALGQQVVLDLYECDPARLDDLPWVRSTLENAARAAGATIVEVVFHKFAPWGISGVVVLAESHLAIHIWPENRYAAIDVFTCGDTVQPDTASAFLVRAFGARYSVQRRFARGGRIPAEDPVLAASTVR